MSADGRRDWFWPCTLLLVGALAAVQTLSIRQEAQTWDEGFEIASGDSFLKTGQYRISLENPPLARVWAALLGRLRDAPFAWYVVLAPVLCYGSIAMAGHINVGLRHLFPLYPFLFIAIGAALARMRFRFRGLAIGLIATGLVVKSLSIYPHYLAFFNLLAGGPAAGPRYLLDSNLDWGQDLKNLETYMVRNGIPEVCALYFGTADMTYYGIEYQYLPLAWETRKRANLDCVAAASVTPLYGLYVANDGYRWLRGLKPVARIGYSIYIYDLRKQRPGR